MRICKENPIAEPIQVFLGDYIDRGQDSAAVLDLLIERASTHQMACLKGNHEIYILRNFSKILEYSRRLGAIWSVADARLLRTDTRQ